MTTSNPKISDVLRNVYTGPAADLLQRRCDVLYAWGTVEVSDFEIKTYMGHEGQFVGILQARITACLDDMAEMLCGTTFPVHDEPGVACDSSWHYA